MSGVACKFGVACTRADCWFQHPAGRAAGPASAAPTSRKPVYNNNVVNNNNTFSAPGGPSIGRGPSAAAASGPNSCRWGRACNRADCYYNHPEGRDIDGTAAPQGGLASGPGARKASPPPSNSSFNPDEWDAEDEENIDDFLAREGCECCGGHPFECATPSCAAIGRCGCVLGEDEVEDDIGEEGDDSYRDEWFPSAMNCGCCSGTIYRCKRQQSNCARGVCFCSPERSLPSSSSGRQ